MRQRSKLYRFDLLIDSELKEMTSPAADSPTAIEEGETSPDAKPFLPSTAVAADDDDEFEEGELPDDGEDEEGEDLAESGDPKR